MYSIAKTKHYHYSVIESAIGGIMSFRSILLPCRDYEQHTEDMYISF